jgi:hypothetical protein
MEDIMTMLNQETLKKITGDIADEVPEATIRMATRRFVREVMALVVAHPQTHDNIRSLLTEYDFFGEALLGFALSAVLEFLPTSKIGDTRKRLAYNLRVQSIEALEDRGVRELMLYIPLLQPMEEIYDQYELAVLSASKVTSKDKQPKSTGSADMTAEAEKHLSKLSEENAGLKDLLAEQSQEINALKERVRELKPTTN